MKMRIVLLGLLISSALWAADEAKPASSLAKENSSVDSSKIVTAANLKNADARLRVEGASFKPFNLYLAPTKIEVLSEGQRKLANDIRSIVERDLNIVGTFNFVTHSNPDKSGDLVSLLRQKGAEGMSELKISMQGDKITVALKHHNLVTGKKGSYSIQKSSKELRHLAHLTSQSIFEAFIGPEDLFVTQFAAVKLTGNNNQIVLLDFDGQNEVPITKGNWSKTSPYFTPDGKNILYTVLTDNGQAIVEQEIGATQSFFRIRKPGLNLDARIFPDNSGMLATLSFEGNTSIYRADRKGAVIGKVLRPGQGLGLNLSPSVSPNGEELVFVSDRSSSPQIYVISLKDKDAKAIRLTSQGRYNQTPTFSPDGKLVAFTGRDEQKVFDIFLVERATGRISRVTEKQGRNQEPFFTSSGRFLIFTSIREGKSKPDIFISSLNGNHQFRLTDAASDSKSKGYMTPIVRPKQRSWFSQKI